VTNGTRVRLRHHSLTRDSGRLSYCWPYPLSELQNGVRHRVLLPIGSVRDAAILSAHPFHLAEIKRQREPGPVVHRPVPVLGENGACKGQRRLSETVEAALRPITFGERILKLYCPMQQERIGFVLTTGCMPNDPSTHDLIIFLVATVLGLGAASFMTLNA